MTSDQSERIATFLAGPVGLWILSFCVFHLNPLNDPSNPLSKMHVYHWENILIRRQIEAETGDGKINYEWSDFAAYFSATVTTSIAYLAYQILTNLCC